MMGNSSAEAAPAAGEAHDSGSSGEVGGSRNLPGGVSDEDKARMDVADSGGGGGGGNRWPRQETLDLLRIRSEMEDAFRNSNLKGPLWEEVCRKMSQLGYQRSGKKCKEKFENLYKYHKRTKDGRAAKSDGKTYRFFEQLEAFQMNPSPLPPPQQPQPHRPRSRSQLEPQAQAQIPTPTTAMAAVPIAVVVDAVNKNSPPISSHVTASLVAAPVPISFSPSLNNNPLFFTLSSSQLPLASTAVDSTTYEPPQGNAVQFSHPKFSPSLPSDFTSSSTSSDEDIRRRRKRKRKLKDFFEGLLKDLMGRQEELHKKFLEALEKRERERMIREEAWRVQEMARLNRELDLLNQERSMAAAKDVAIRAFLQKFTGQPNPQTPQIPSTNNVPPQIQAPLPQLPQNSQPPPPQRPPPSVSISTSHVLTPASATAPAAHAPSSAPAPAVEAHAPVLFTRNVGTIKDNNGSSENFMTPNSSRWPKAEVEALIKLRTSLDVKYQENGPKGPLWEEISSMMSKLGYNRNAKRCKEKWENINKYFKKVKESNKKRHEDSKACPYFQQLEALYKEKAKADGKVSSQISFANAMKPENSPIPIMARPEQQWPILRQESAMAENGDHDSGNFDEIDEDEEQDEGGGYEIVTKKPQVPVSVATSTTSAAE